MDDKIVEVVVDDETELVCEVRGEVLRLEDVENVIFEVIVVLLEAVRKAENVEDTDAHDVDDALLEDVAVFELFTVFEE